MTREGPFWDVMAGRVAPPPSAALRVIRRGKDIGFMAGELVDDSGQVVAAATATAVIRATRPS